ncbi:peptidylprolyl isomerase [Candidatus Nitrospira allomarina]|uniref:peptidylprolyl isomerase n=1 Tax=Candidatus Nitrospira allomarina TaxID=3020900 RepID=A0AA96GAM9_9BACT|nr:peptidylprolyl isomerase [Candidatus Nitrospira allomarina]WNM57532.1 peptidylprolyl isomerase [Candidatus Nitrospira allomarina]
MIGLSRREEVQLEERVDPDQDEPASVGRTPSRLMRWGREPLLHFLLIGVAIFVGYHLLQPETTGPDVSDRIVLTGDDLRQLKATWLAQGRPSPTPEDMRRLIGNKVREEIFYREALALGLDKEDIIVKRRLAQKMEFLIEDLAALRNPTTEELRAWYEKNPERFTPAPRVSFHHLYFSPDRRGAGVKDEAESVREQLNGKPLDTPVRATSADSFMFKDSYNDRTPEQVASVFGTTFAEALLLLTPGSWQGPIESGLGWHIVWVESITPGRIPAFEEIEQDIKAQWTEEQRIESSRRTFDAMKARYEVILPHVPTMVDRTKGG